MRKTRRPTARPLGRSTSITRRAKQAPRGAAASARGRRSSGTRKNPPPRRRQRVAEGTLELALRPGFRAGTPDPIRRLGYGPGTPESRRPLGYGPGGFEDARPAPLRRPAQRTEEVSGPSFFPWPSNWEPVHTGYRVVADRSTAKLARITSVSEAVAHANATTFDVAPPAEPYGEGHLRAHGVVPVQGSPSPVREAWGEAFRARRDEWVRANLQGRALFTREHQVGGWDSGYPPTYSTAFWWDDPSHFLGGYRIEVPESYTYHKAMKATPEVQARDEERERRVQEGNVREQMEASVAAAAREMYARNGDIAIVTKGNKVPIGTIGVVSGVFDSTYGLRARLAPLDNYGRTIIKGGGADTYTAIGNLATLLGRDDVRPPLRRPDGSRDRVDFNAPVSDLARRVLALGPLAWVWAWRDAALCAPVMDPLLPSRVAWTCRDCEGKSPCGLRYRRARRLLVDYVNLLSSDPAVVGVATAFLNDPPRLDATTAHTLPELLDPLPSVRADLDRYGLEFSGVGGSLAFLNENAPAAAREATLASLRAVVAGALGYTYEEPKSTKGTGTRKPRQPSRARAKK